MVRILGDVAFRIARDGLAKLVLHEGKPVIVDGKKLYEVKYETRLLMKLLAGRDREKYGDVKVIEVNWKDWDGDVSKLSPGAVRGLLDVLRKEAARQEAEAAARQAARQPVGIVPAAVKQELVEQITAESEERPWALSRQVGIVIAFLVSVTARAQEESATCSSMGLSQGAL